MFKTRYLLVITVVTTSDGDGDEEGYTGADVMVLPVG